MKINKEIAEITGLLIGDGCLSKYRSYNANRLEIAFTGHLKEYRYYKEFVKPIFIKYFNVKGTLRIRNEDTSTRYHIKSIKAFNYFKNIGVQIGEKEIVELPPIIKQKPYIWIAFIRGLFDAEGSIYRRYSKKYKNHTRIYDNLLVAQIKFNCSKEFIKFIEHVLITNKIKTNRITKIGKSYIIRITKQESIEKFLDIFKPKIKNAPFDKRAY